MNFLSVLLLAVALGMDAFSVAVCAGTSLKRVKLPDLLRISLCFGLFQFVMPIAGWFAAQTVIRWIERYDHWIAFFLLAYVGAGMIWSAGRQRPQAVDPTRGLTLLMLSIATSIDAFAVGLSLAFLEVAIVYPSIVIGIVAFLMTAAGYILGEQTGKLLGRKAEILGGIILIGIGVNILVTHL